MKPDQTKFCATMAAAIGAALSLQANPSGLTVVSGSAATQSSGSHLNVTVSSAAVLNSNSFNILPGQSTSFLQPSPGSVVLNTIGGNSPSKIWGNLTANGTVILANAYGFYFGPHSEIKVGGNFIATTAPLLPDFGLGASWEFTGLPPLARIVNYGQIDAGAGHALYLIAEQIDNHGDLNASEGQVGLEAGSKVLVSESPDGRGLSATVALPAGAVDNSGRINANAGEIALDAQVVNQNGILQANSVQNQNGVIELTASDQLTLGANSQIVAKGDSAVPESEGGDVTLRSGETFNDSHGSRIVTTGGAQGGNGGNIEISAPNVLSLNSTMNAGAAAGWTAGQFFLDPANITLATSGTGSAGAGSVLYNNGTGTLALDVNTAFKNFSQITLQATGNITLNTGTTWNLSASTGKTTGQLTLQAGGNIIFDNNSLITDANNWSVTLQAGVSFPSGAVQSGAGFIYLNGGPTTSFSGTVQTSAGAISMTAGESILVGTGAIRTTGGGDISLTAKAGDINAGTGNGGYVFAITGTSISAALGQIATAAGGNVALTAGDDIISTPTSPSGQPPGASGAYGSEQGNVTLTAGNEVLGNFTVANGVGTILAGVDVQDGAVTQILNPSASVGVTSKPVNLSLIDGTWNVWSGGDINIGEVRNPSGAFNSFPTTVPVGAFPGNVGSPTVPAQTTFAFNYAANAAANFWADDAITLIGANLPRVSGQNQSMPPVYPPVLTLAAGSGGVTVENPVILYPSSEGALQITTTDGGNLTGAQQQSTLVGITMSGSGLPGWATFAQGQALTPLYQNNPNPVVLNIAGSINSFGLTVPTFADVDVTGNTYNFGFLGQNVSPSQTTTIDVTGSVTYRGNLTSVPLADPLPSVLFNSKLSGDPAVTSLLTYDATAGTLTFIGQMSATDLAFLLSPTEVVLNGAGEPEVTANGTPVTKPLPLNATQIAALNQLYANSQNATLGDQGLAMAGPGKFFISAGSMDLGISGGISVLPPNSALTAISKNGASLNVNVTGDLDMTSTKIDNESLDGSLTLTVGGALDVGGEYSTFGDPNAPKGVFTTGGGNLSVDAVGSINVDGSRIATYDGGNITVESQTGSINAGEGGSGYVSFNAPEISPKTGQLIGISATIPGSGILATTVPGSDAHLGNITIDTPHGDIDASLGGILQIGFNGLSSASSLVTLNAGGNINASGSGVIGSIVQLKAGGNITGVVLGRQSVAINSSQNVAVTVFSGGDVNIAASGTVSGTVVSGGSVSVSGDSISAALVGSSVSASGDTSTASVGIPQSNVARDDSRGVDEAATNTTEAVATSFENAKSKSSTIGLMQRTGRVSVILPGRK